MRYSDIWLEGLIYLNYLPFALFHRSPDVMYTIHLIFAKMLRSCILTVSCPQAVIVVTLYLPALCA